MVTVCKTCYLIYHTIDGERFQASRSTSRAAARLYNAKMLASLEHAVAASPSPSASVTGATRPRADQSRTRAWEVGQDGTA